MNANQLAEMLECLGWRSVDANLREAAEMLRRQHEAIVKLRGALEEAKAELESIREVRQFELNMEMKTHRRVSAMQVALNEITNRVTRR